MNTRHDELETLLGAGLHDRAGDVGGRWVELQDVRDRATTIRRRRRVGAGIGVAAALAIVVPLSMTAGGLIGAEEDVQPARPSPSPTEVVRTTLTLDGLERGSAPGVEYFTPDGVVLPGQGLQPLEDSLQAIVRNEAEGGWFAVSPSKDQVLDLTDDFEQTSASTITQAFVSSPDRSSVAWTVEEPGGQALTLRSTTESGAGRAWDFPATPRVDPVDFVGEGSLLFETTTRDGRLREIGIAHEDGSTSTLAGDFLAAISANPETGLVAVQTKANEDLTGCYGVVDPAESTSTPVWETCDYSLDAFSPDGSHVLASDPYQSGGGRTSLSVLDARTGDLVASFQQPRGGRVTLTQTAWESADTTVAVAFEGTSFAILRFGLDGTLEETIDRFDADPMGDLPLYLGLDRIRF